MPPDIDEVELTKVLSKLESGQDMLRADLARYFAEAQRERQEAREERKTHSQRLGKVEIDLAVQDERLDALNKKVNNWGTTNSLGAIVAGIVGWFR